MIIAANGDTVFEDEVQSLAAAIFRRFGCDPKEAASAWRRLHQNKCSTRAFMSLLRGGAVTSERAGLAIDRSTT